MSLFFSSLNLFALTLYIHRGKKIDAPAIDRALDELKGQGAEVIVASKAFGVDNIREELMVQESAEKQGMMVSVASEIS